MAKLILKSKRERSVQRFHPWIYSGAIKQVEGSLDSGDIVEVVSAENVFLGRGFYNGNSNIRCRLLTWQDEAIDEAFIYRKMQSALQLRSRLLNLEGADVAPLATDAFRLINAEGDGLPGLIVDKYADHLVMQISALGMSRLREMVVTCLQRLLSPAGIFERSSGASLAEEGMAQTVRSLSGEPPPSRVMIRENRFKFEVEIEKGQKTGFYLDQRDNREWAGRLANDRTVLNGFGYTGAFSVYAAAGGAKHVVTVDSSHNAIELAARNLEINGFRHDGVDLIAADLFVYLRSPDRLFDFIILDPPSFAQRQKDVNRAARAYKDINLQAIKKIAPGGLLLTCSCSQPVSADLFQKILFAAATDAKRNVRILGESGHAPDHPVSIYHPEGRYLKTFLLAVD